MSSFNPKPEAMAGSEIDRPHVAPAIAAGFGLNEVGILSWRGIETPFELWIAPHPR